LDNNFIYDAGQKYAQNAMREFAGLSIPAHVRGLIQTQIKLAYIAACKDVYTQVGAILGVRASEKPALDPLNFFLH
jgi:hypothetical protein